MSFVCLTDRDGGTTQTFMCTTTGRGNNVKLKAAAHGTDLETGPVITTQRHLLASIVAHEFGPALALGDEYGEGKWHEPDGRG